MLAAFFSPTGTTQKIVRALTAQLQEVLYNQDLVNGLRLIDFTPMSERVIMNTSTELRIDSDELFILGVPVYAGVFVQFSQYQGLTTKR